MNQVSTKDRPRTDEHSCLQTGLRSLALGVGLAITTYAASVGVTWSRYGRPSEPKPEEHDELLERFMPVYDVAERHHIPVTAPAAVTLSVARDIGLFDAPLVRAMFKGRELLLHAAPAPRPRPRGLLEDMQSLGWVILAESPGKEIVVGAVTKPWEANVTFRSVPAEAFAAFNEPDYIKIVWTLRADHTHATSSIFRTETRAVATDHSARVKFRRYWALLSPGIVAIRWMMLGPVKSAAERRAREGEAPLRTGSQKPGHR